MVAIVTGLVWFAAISAGVMAGIYFTFSVFGMRALGELPDEEGARAMQSINRVILKSAFLPLFFVSTLVCAGLVIAGLIGLPGPASAAPAMAGGAIYVIGMFGVTAAGNVPLNNRLDAANPRTAEGAAIWQDYLIRWTRLNHVRTLACTAASALLIYALVAG